MLNKFIFGNKQIPEMYFGNIPVAKIYFGTTLIWEKEGYVPYDDTCTATVTLSQDKTAWIVTITKNGEDVTSSLKQMITWIYNGKGARVEPYNAYSNTIDLSQHPRGDYRLDLSRITSKDNSWFPSEHAISFPDHIYIGTLLAGDKNVAIEYIPSANIIISGIEIFTSQNSSHTSGRVKIIHESGLYVGSVNGDAKDGSTELYGLTGWKRYVNNASIQLYGGKKYFIVFNDDSPVTAYYPAYFQNETGNYKEYSNDTDNVTLTDISNYGDYIGYVDNLATVINTSITNIFIWNSDENFNNALLKNKCYSRANKDMTGKTLYSNVTLGQNNSHALDDNDKETIANMAANTVFIWMGQTNLGMQNGYNYVKKSGIPVAKVTEDFSGLSDNITKIAKLLLDIKNAAAENGAVSCKANIWGEYQDGLSGSLVTLKSAYTVQYNSMTPATVDPDTPIENGLYYFNNSNGKTGVYLCTDAVNKTYKIINQYNWSGNSSGSPYLSELVDKYSTVDTIETWGTVADWVSFVAENNAISLTFASAETKHDRKYYVKLTDSNNNSFEV